MTADPNIAGVILAGGAGRRMFPHSSDGGDKGLAHLAGVPLLTHVIGRLRPQVERLVLNANGDPARYAPFGLDIISDGEAEGQGPLAGVLAALDWAQCSDRDFRAVLSISTDIPFLPRDAAQRLRAASKDLTRPAVAQSAGRLHPTIGLWPVGLHAALRDTLARGHRSAEKFARSQEAIAVPFACGTIGGRTVDPFFNANTPEDLAEAEALLAAMTREDDLGESSGAHR